MLKDRFNASLISNEKLAIPEYTIDLLNKNKKILKKVENIEKIEKNLVSKYEFNKRFIHKKNIKNFKSRNKFRWSKVNKLI